MVGGVTAVATPVPCLKLRQQLLIAAGLADFFKVQLSRAAGAA